MKIILIQFISLFLIIIMCYSCKEKNNAPIIEDQIFQIDENSPNGSIVGTVIAEDDDIQTISFNIIDGNQENVFSINSVSGEINVTNTSFLDYETNPVFELTVEVTDNGTDPMSSSAIISINLIDVTIPTNNMIAYYPFNGNANDESGNSNNGIVNGATLTTDRNGILNSAYGFDGIINYIDFNTALLPIDGSDFSISLWINSENDVNNQVRAIFSQYLSNPAGRFQLYEYQGKIKLFSGDTDYPSTSVAVELCNFEQNNWVNIILVNDNNQMDVYLNGNLIKENLTIYNVLYTNSIAGWNNFENCLYKGKIDDIIIYDHILSENEIKILYLE